MTLAHCCPPATASQHRNGAAVATLATITSKRQMKMQVAIRILELIILKSPFSDFLGRANFHPPVNTLHAHGLRHVSDHYIGAGYTTISRNARVEHKDWYLGGVHLSTVNLNAGN